VPPRAARWWAETQDWPEGAAVRAARGGVGRRVVATRAVRQHSREALQPDILHIVVGVGTGELGVSGAVAGFALQAAMAFGEAVEREACAGVSALWQTSCRPACAGRRIIERRSVANLAAVHGGGAVWQFWQAGSRTSPAARKHLPPTWCRGNSGIASASSRPRRPRCPWLRAGTGCEPGWQR